MPIYEFECERTGQVFERIMPLHLSDLKKVECEFHSMCRGIKIPSRLGLTSGLSQTTPTVIFRNANNPNDIRPAVYKGQQTPHGFIKEELKTPMERSRVEREMASIQDAQDDFDTAKREFVTNHVRKERHSDLRARMNSLTEKSDNPALAEHLLKKGMERSNKKRVPR